MLLLMASGEQGTLMIRATATVSPSRLINVSVRLPLGAARQRHDAGQVSKATMQYHDVVFRRMAPECAGGGSARCAARRAFHMGRPRSALLRPLRLSPPDRRRRANLPQTAVATSTCTTTKHDLEGTNRLRRQVQHVRPPLNHHRDLAQLTDSPRVSSM